MVDSAPEHLARALRSIVDEWRADGGLEPYRQSDHWIAVEHLRDPRFPRTDLFEWESVEGARVLLQVTESTGGLRLRVDHGYGPGPAAGVMYVYRDELDVSASRLERFEKSRRHVTHDENKPLDRRSVTFLTVAEDIDARLGRLADDGHPLKSSHGGDQPLIRHGGEELLRLRRLTPAAPVTDVLAYAHDMEQRAGWLRSDDPPPSQGPDAGPTAGRGPSGRTPSSQPPRLRP